MSSGRKVSQMARGRQDKILSLLSTNLSNLEIGDSLGITGNTVKSDLTIIYRRIGVSNRTAAANWYRENGAGKP